MSVSPGPSPRHRRVVKDTVELIGSMRFAIALLVLIAIASLVGTVVNQQEPYPNYVNQFGPFWADIFRALGIFDVYSSSWFLLIMAFLVVSISICVWRNGPKMLADARNWKDRVREQSLLAFGHRDAFPAAQPRGEAVGALQRLLTRRGYKFVTRDKDASETGGAGATLIAAKRGTASRFGYISAHLAIVVICVGGLLDSGLGIHLQSWMFNKTPIAGQPMVGGVSDAHRLATWNPSFRGYAWVPEGQQVSTAILNRPNGMLVQDLPITIQLKKFVVDYYSTGMPKLFASDIVVVDHATGKTTPVRIEVNKPATFDGISIYQSSFEDGGTTLALSLYPMHGAGMQPKRIDGKIGGSYALGDGQTLEFVDFRAINVENMSNADGRNDVRGVAKRSLAEAFDERLGSGAKTSRPQSLHNIGPSLRFKLRDASGQAREFNNYMVPTTIDGESLFLAGMRATPDAPFRYLRLPADADGSLTEWMRLRAALADPNLRAIAASRFAERSGRAGGPAMIEQLRQSALRVLSLFAGADAPPAADAQDHASGASGAPGGFTAVAGFIERTVPKAEQEKAAGLLLRVLQGSVWDLWQAARERDSQPPLQPDEHTGRFIDTSLNALSDSFFYGSPVFLQLDSFKQVQASVFQLTRAPGKKIVYLGSLLLVLGVFAMFYIRERRVWFWIKDRDQGAQILMAMSCTRKTLDFETEFRQLRAAARAEAGAPPAPDAP
ncbi:cytochrome c biogenesis protein ResB [Chitinasiproducens palmae]|uniref:Cytochrome c biogenesis protein n=1 Tax=Chitinasiproducens palmae TaxID=1770053 RepID=A0A1H2PVI5_9BURK|nr:cytochrome c biogenesis protein ResB [Chitinasiproducens palmae]SDV51338.1 cytochrome c biogenesis protein [Chitinasiproducens palmae]